MGRFPHLFGLRSPLRSHALRIGAYRFLLQEWIGMTYQWHDKALSHGWLQLVRQSEWSLDIEDWNQVSE